MKRTAADIRADIYTVAQEIISGKDDISFPLLLEEAEEKAIACLHVLTRMHAEILEGKVHLDRAKAYIDQRKRAVERLEAEISLTLEAMGTNKIDRPDGRVTVLPAKKVVVIDDETKIPDDFMVVIPESKRPDKKALAEILKDGIAVEGARLEDGKSGLRYDKPKGD